MRALPVTLQSVRERCAWILTTILELDAYNADEYLEDGIHLNEKGRSLYAKTIASCLLYGTEGQISGNNIASFN